jgi:UDP-N-acetylmuramoyl-tripeptide--D-alanyl-D-alanine ligase
MSDPLWGWDEMVRASGGAAEGASLQAITGLSIDTRTLAPGEVFVALKDQRDGHEFVSAAFARGAAAALVSATYEKKPGDGALIRVPDPLSGLTGIARAARARLSPEAGVVAVTGSVGKTSTKEMLRACLSRLGPTHAPEKSFNNHWGVPLTLARMPATTRYAVIEIGMNHAGEITPLTQLTRPQVAIITTVEPVHLGHFNSVEEIADAKAEIILGIEPGGVAILNRDNRHFARLEAAARKHGADVVAFGETAGCYVRMVRCTLGPEGTDIEAECGNGRIVFRLAAPGRHMAMNALAVVGAIETLGNDFESTIHAIGALARFGAPQGRGARERLEGPGGAILLIDESYNANPASMRAALEAMALVPRSDYPRRVAVLGDMLELGATAPELHAGLLPAIEAAGIDLVLTAGPHMRALHERLPAARRGAWAASADGLVDAVSDAVDAGSSVMVKGSYGSRMGPVVAAIRARFGRARA